MIIRASPAFPFRVKLGDAARDPCWCLALSLSNQQLSRNTDPHSYAFNLRPVSKASVPFLPEDNLSSSSNMDKTTTPALIIRLKWNTNQNPSSHIILRNSVLKMNPDTPPPPQNSTASVVSTSFINLSYHSSVEVRILIGRKVSMWKIGNKVTRFSPLYLKKTFFSHRASHILCSIKQ